MLRGQGATEAGRATRAPTPPTKPPPWQKEVVHEHEMWVCALPLNCDGSLAQAAGVMDVTSWTSHHAWSFLPAPSPLSSRNIRRSCVSAAASSTVANSCRFFTALL